MRFLLSILILLLLAQPMTSLASCVFPELSEKVVLDIEEEQEDGEEEVEKEIDEIFHPNTVFGYRLIEIKEQRAERFVYSAGEYQDVCQKTPFSPPDLV